MTAFLIFAAFVLTVLVCIVVTKRNRDAFKKRFPPISDAEFLALCPPETNPEVALKVRRIISEHFAIDYECIHPSARFIEDFGVD
jgi:hypothetical protein